MAYSTLVLLICLLVSFGLKEEEKETTNEFLPPLPTHLSKSETGPFTTHSYLLEDSTILLFEQVECQTPLYETFSYQNFDDFLKDFSTYEWEF